MYTDNGILFKLDKKDHMLLDDGSAEYVIDRLKARSDRVPEDYGHVHDGYEFKEIIFGKTDRDKFLRTYNEMIDATVSELRAALRDFLNCAEPKGFSNGVDFTLNEDSMMRLLNDPNNIMNFFLCKVGKIISGEYCCGTSLIYINLNSAAADGKYIHRVYNKPENYALAVYSVHF
jgi:hypothetical protein